MESQGFLIRELQEIFNKHDVSGVFGMTKEKDEYYSEIEQMLIYLLRKTDSKELSQNLNNIFERMFDKKFDKKRIDNLAKDVLKTINGMSKR